MKLSAWVPLTRVSRRATKRRS